MISQTKIVEYEYWINNDYSSSIKKQINANQLISISEDLPITKAKFGFNLLSIRFKDNQGRWSSTVTRIFFNTLNSGESSRRISEVEYWINNDFNNRQKLIVDSGNIVANIDISQIPNGFHHISFRFKDNTGLFSSAITKVIFKAGQGKENTNKIAAYRYWFGNTFEQTKTVQLSEPTPLAKVSTIIDLPPDTVESFNIQFLDTAGLWSTVYTRKFLPEANFVYYNTINSYTFTNLTTFGKIFIWDFGDGNKSNAVNPSHTYSRPGVYDVCLISTNNLGADTLCKTVFVYGLREVAPSKAGNTSDVTLFIYGAGFDSKTKVYLRDNNGAKIEPTRVQHYKLDALKCLFDLREKPLGLYDVVAEFNGKEYRLDSSFSIEAGTKAQPFVNLSGRDRILFGRWQTYTLNFGNKGNVDAVGVPLVFIVSESAGLEIEFPELLLNQNPILQNDTNFQNYWKSLPNYFTINNLFDEPFNGRVYYYYIPSIPGNYTGSMSVRIKTDRDVQLSAWLTEPYFASPLDRRVEWCIRLAMLKAIKDGIIDIGLNNAPLIGCINQLWTNYLDRLYGMLLCQIQTHRIVDQNRGRKLYSLGEIAH